MTTDKGAQFPSLRSTHAPGEIFTHVSCNEEAFQPPLGNGTLFEDDIAEDEVGSYKTKDQTIRPENVVLRSQKDETQFDKLYEETKAIKTVTLKLSNNLKKKSLMDPDLFVISGKNHSPFDNIHPGESQRFLFAKTPWSCRGVIGICTYRVEGTDDRVAIYYCNPFIGHNSFGLRWVEASHVTNASTYRKCFSVDNKWLVRDNMRWKEVTSPSGLYIARAFMTQSEHVKMDVNVGRNTD